MKRFLRKVGLLTAAVMMMSSGVAIADDAQPSHGWMRSAPSDSMANFAEVGARTDNNLRRNQTLYWAIENDGGQAKVIDTSDPAAPVKNNCTVGDDCASAPLFISAPSAVICAGTDLALAASPSSGQIQFSLVICSDSSCTDNTSVGNQTLSPGALGLCKEFSGPDKYDGFNVGSLWVYIEVVAGAPPVAGTTALVWITGN